jgi:hypothetical protein
MRSALHPSPEKNGSRPLMVTATEYRAESQWCVELASLLARQDRELSNTMMVLAQRYNWAARQAEGLERLVGIGIAPPRPRSHYDTAYSR